MIVYPIVEITNALRIVETNEDEYIAYSSLKVQHSKEKDEKEGGGSEFVVVSVW